MKGRMKSTSLTITLNLLIFITFDAVLTKKIILSILLLFTYSLGFAHSFIPHQHTTETHEHVHEENGHTHHHHSTKEQAHQDHEHITHGDHFDEGLYDLIVCFLHDANQHQQECDLLYVIPTKTNNTSTNKSQHLKLVATQLVFPLKAEQAQSIHQVEANSTICYRSSSLEDSPLRGPPTPKC
jgi:hypothetical protein